MTRYDTRTAAEAAAAQAAGAILLLPLGAVEQHGPALPLGTDTLRAEAVAERVAADFTDTELLVLPALAYGVSPHHDRFPATISLSPMLFSRLLVELATGLADSGWRKLFILTGHGGNNAAISLAQQQLLADRCQLTLAWSPITPLARDANRAIARTEVSGHSGESETAQLLALHPDLVRADRLEPGATTLAGLTPQARLSRTASPKLLVRFDEYADNGVLGDPRTATADDGRRVLDEATAVITAYLRDFLSL